MFTVQISCCVCPCLLEVAQHQLFFFAQEKVIIKCLAVASSTFVSCTCGELHMSPLKTIPKTQQKSPL